MVRHLCGRLSSGSSHAKVLQHEYSKIAIEQERRAAFQLSKEFQSFTCVNFKPRRASPDVELHLTIEVLDLRSIL